MKRRVRAALVAFAVAFGAGYAWASEFGHGPPISGREIAAAMVTGIPVTTAECADTYVGGVTTCTASRPGVSGARVRVTVRRINPMHLRIDVDSQQPRSP